MSYIHPIASLHARASFRQALDWNYLLHKGRITAIKIHCLKIFITHLLVKYYKGISKNMFDSQSCGRGKGRADIFVKVGDVFNKTINITAGPKFKIFQSNGASGKTLKL